MKIQELLPHLKKGWVAMDKDGIWAWFSCKPTSLTGLGFWTMSSNEECIILGYAIVIEPFDGDWKDSLMECGK